MDRCTCPCGKDKDEDKIVCHPCWNASPLELRQQHNQVFDPKLKRDAARQLKGLARERKPAVTPKANQLQLIL